MPADPAGPALLEAHNLRCNFGSVPAVSDLSFTVGRGEVLGLLGVNGAGKSTTMDMLCGVRTPNAGNVRVCGIDLRRDPRRAKRQIGYLPETPPLYPELSVLENLEFSARIHGLRGPALQRSRDAVLQRCALEGEAARLAGNLSRGFRQRLGLAQALLHEPALLVLDEPSAGLDPLQLREFRDLIASLARERAVVLSTHVLPEVTAVCSRVLILHRGRAVHESALADLSPGDAPVILRCAREPDATLVRELREVSQVERRSGHALRVVPAPGANAVAVLARLALEQDWGLEELAREHTALERAFVEVSCGEGAVPA